ncbi:restriction endonuclease [Arthrobacter sp. ISL-48]|uniref:McrC family protein n=1 Tax=Arthrobacter sp. ISL-48 TaxID=2819110 RepID=UPI001BE7A351|nr:McrC family protein [Arthrobacter sp. ISL-48]MBT2532799.1 restriction endonuclease [Arthrobacter sp. ISL-48]
MRWLQLQESSTPERHSISDDVATALNRLDIATVTPAGGGHWTIANVRKVGVIQVADFQIVIHPKVPVARLFFMMGYALDREFWQDEDITISSDTDSDLVSTIAATFLRHVAKATRQGLLQGYESYEESLPIVRGRINIPAQIGRRGGLAFPAQVVFDEYTVDVAENRLLLTAARRLLNLTTLPHQIRTDLRKTTQLLDGATTLISGHGRPRIQFTRLNSRYRAALLLAEIILENSSLEQDSGEITATAFLFDMWKIFEDFVTTTLAQGLERSGGTATSQATGTYLDVGSKVALRPDLLWHDGDRPRAVIDAKYKAAKFANYPNADVYQMLAYCVRLGLDTGHLVYAEGEEEPRIHEVLGHKVSVHCHAIDLHQDPTALLEQMSRLAEKIAERGNPTLLTSAVAQAYHR